MIVREALASDADGIARVHIRAWQEAYSSLLPAGALDDLDEEFPARTTRWAAIIADGVTDVRVAERDGQIVGWATSSAGRGADLPRDLELEGIYVLASEYGTGTGQALFDAAIGDRAAFLWSAAENVRAQAFYRRNGFELDGASSEHPLHGHPVQIVRFVR